MMSDELTDLTSLDITIQRIALIGILVAPFYVAENEDAVRELASSAAQQLVDHLSDDDVMALTKDINSVMTRAVGIVMMRNVYAMCRGEEVTEAIIERWGEEAVDELMAKEAGQE